jgi:hypothetical protein
MKRGSGILAILFVCAVIGYVWPRIALAAFPSWQCKTNTCAKNFVCCANANNSLCCDFTKSMTSYGACNGPIFANCPLQGTSILCTGATYKSSGGVNASCNRNPKVGFPVCGGVMVIGGPACDQEATCGGNGINEC